MKAPSSQTAVRQAAEDLCACLAGLDELGVLCAHSPTTLQRVRVLAERFGRMALVCEMAADVLARRAIERVMDGVRGKEGGAR